MPMNYEKITVPRFAERLKAGMYKNVTAARRAIGKADWSEQERQKAQAITNKHFGASDVARPSKPSVSAKVSVDQGPKKSERSAVALPSTSTTSSQRKTSGAAPTNAEIIDLCGVAHDLLQALIKAAELSAEGRPLMMKGMAVVYNCMRIVQGALDQTSVEGTVTSAQQGLRDLGKQVAPQSFISRRRSNNALAASPTEARSAASGR